MKALWDLISDPATGNIAVFIIVFFMFRMDANIRRLFVRVDENTKEISTVKGEHNASLSLGNCPASKLADIVAVCPALEPRGSIGADNNTFTGASQRTG